VSYLFFLVFFLFLVRKRSPHFTEFLANSAEGNIGVVLFDFLTVFLAAMNYVAVRYAAFIIWIEKF